jgi:hypothetical protein
MRHIEVLVVFDDDDSVYIRLPDWQILHGGLQESMLIQAVRSLLDLGLKQPCIPEWEELALRSRGRTLVWIKPPRNLLRTPEGKEGG